MRTLQRLVIAGLLLAPTLLLAQGLFPPPSAPTVPLMKSLTQVEPRTPIPSGTLPADYNFTTPFSITKSGSYYLTGNITVASNINAITVGAGVNDVSIDLNGFTIESTLASAGSGQAISFSTAARIRISNGNIKSSSTVSGTGVVDAKGFSNGIYAGNLTASSISGINVIGIGGTGIYCDGTSIVENCTVAQCGYGIRNLSQGITRNCIASNCAILGIESTTAESCSGTATAVLDPSPSAPISTGLRATTATNCTGTGNFGAGLTVTNSATNCTGTSTSGFGISGIGTADSSSPNVNATVTATGCTGTSTANAGMVVKIALNCNGTSTDSTGIQSETATNCIGRSTSQTGLQATTATNCNARSSDGTGLSATNATNCIARTNNGIALSAANATNCTGITVSGTGLSATNATNCVGSTGTPSAGNFGLSVSGTANTCQGRAPVGATALKAAIAIGCTVTNGGSLDVPVGKQFNM